MKSVLLIDDDVVSNFVNKKNFELTGLVDKLQIASNGRDGLALFMDHYSENNLPGFIFLDINMPFMSGFEFLEKFNAISIPGKEKIIVVMMSSSESDKDVVRAKNLGVTRYIFKPLKQVDIIELLK